MHLCYQCLLIRDLPGAGMSNRKVHHSPDNSD